MHRHCKLRHILLPAVICFRFGKLGRHTHVSVVQARIDALMAAPPESTPHPVSLQPSVAAALQGQRRATERAIIHLDMDCFFASIAVQVGLTPYRLYLKLHISSGWNRRIV